MSSSDTTINRLLDLASTRYKVERQALSAGDDFFEKLGIDSMEAMELLSDVEMTFDVEIPDYELEGVVTFQALAEQIDVRS
jgi:acyl carrier protein